MEWLLVGAALVLAFANGANDNMKGVATAYGSGELGYRAALTLATLSTAAGALASLVLATSLVKAFSGKGLIPPEFLDATLLTAVAGAAALTVVIATRVGLPISTTHAIVGALVGAGMVIAGSALELGALGSAVVLPLAAGPILAIGLAWAIARGGSEFGARLGLAPGDCICVTSSDVSQTAPSTTHGTTSIGMASTAHAAVQLEIAPSAMCDGHGHGHEVVAGVHVDRALSIGHWMSAGTVGFARGLNDTPKILGLVVGASAIAPLNAALAISVAMALGGILAARRVAETLAHDITPIRPSQGLAANLATSLLVVGASRFGLPVSTTHVSTGGIFGIGAVEGGLQRGAVTTILAAWLGTLPLAAALGASLAWGLTRIGA
jgi:PiT family inorganic phosphate transporter